MKNTKLSLLGALAIAGGMFFAGCEDPCKDVNCNFGTCVEGTCECDNGYEGSDCANAINAKFDGTYTLSETCNPSGPASYTITVSPSSSNLMMANINGLWEVAQASVMADIDADGLGFVIERTALGTSGFDIESTNGTINADGSSISLTYSIYATGSTTAVDQCTGTMTRQ